MKKSFHSVVIAIFAAHLALSPALASDSKRRHPSVALALGGGGVRGAAHIGVLRVLEREGIPIDYVVGNSMGAVVGGLHCAGVPLDKVQSVLSDGSLVSAYLPRFLWCRILLSPVRNVIYTGRKKTIRRARQWRKVKDNNWPIAH